MTGRSSRRRSLYGGRLATLGAIASATGGFATAAVAQEQGSLEDQTFVVTRNISVTQRPRPAYTAIGARFGSFVLTPKAELREEYNDNIYALTTKRSDFVTVLLPSATLASDWGRHSLIVQADGQIDRAARTGTENTEQFGIVADGRIDIRHDLDVSLRAGFGEFVQDRTASSAVQITRKPTEFSRLVFGGVVRKEFNRVRLIGRISYTELNYRNGVRLFDPTIPVVESDRDRDIIDPHLRLEYAFSPATIIFAEGGYTRKQYKQKVPLDRDSQGGDYVVGIRLDATKLIRASLAVGYAKRFYTLPLADIGGFTFRGRIEYFPTQLITVTLDGSRGIEDVASVFSGGLLATRFGAKVDYELLRNLLINAHATYLRNDFRSFDRRDRQTTAGIGARYLVGRNYELAVGYNFHDQRSRGIQRTRDFDQSLVHASLTLKL